MYNLKGYTYLFNNALLSSHEPAPEVQRIYFRETWKVCKGKVNITGVIPLTMPPVNAIINSILNPDLVKRVLKPSTQTHALKHNKSCSYTCRVLNVFSFYSRSITAVKKMHG